MAGSSLCPIEYRMEARNEFIRSDGEQAAVEYWQVNRGDGQRAIVEIISEAP